MKAIFYGFQFPHHGRFSAFNGFCRSLKNTGVEIEDATWPRILNMRGFRRFHLSWMKRAERRLWDRIAYTGCDVVHYFFPENSLFKDALRRKRTQKLVLTLHLPGGEAFLEDIKTTKPELYAAIHQADGIILMAPDDVDVYQQIAPKSRVVFLPHGIDTRFFAPQVFPAVRAGKRRRVITVGTMLRDYAFWARTVQKALALTDDVDFVVVSGRKSLEEARHAFGGSLPPRVQWLSNISDEELLNQYAESDMLFLPLHQAWANNALLEALAMGLPIMTTDLVSTRAYLGECGTFFQNRDAAGVADQLIRELDKDASQLRQALRMRAVERYGWDVIATQHLRFYEELMGSSISK